MHGRAAGDKDEGEAEVDEAEVDGRVAARYLREVDEDVLGRSMGRGRAAAAGLGDEPRQKLTTHRRG
jgi:hypothetical protein